MADKKNDTIIPAIIAGLLLIIAGIVIFLRLRKNTSMLRKKVIHLATAEGIAWQWGKRKEADMIDKVKQYWLTGVGWLPSQPNYWSTVPWSAVFISTIFRNAGAGPEFPQYASAHADYIVAAKKNRATGARFKLLKLTEARPEAGDIIVRTRNGSGASFDNIRVGMETHGDIVLEVKNGSCSAVGGNVVNSVSVTNIALSAAGYIIEPGYFGIIKY
jgi:hypothetical protein